MKYCVENDLSVFEFHDSVFSFVSFDGKDLVVTARHLNIHKCTAQNPPEHDMEIECAQITFRGFHSPACEPGKVWKTGEDGQSYPVGPRVVFSGREAMDRFLKELQNQITVLHFEKEEHCGYSIGGCGNEPYFTIEFDFDSVAVRWDNYIKKAWYELHKQYQYDFTISTLTGDAQIKVMVGYHDEDALDQPPSVNVGCQYDGKAYWGHGSDYLWIDAFADLQRQLPESVTLKCCLTCRHGNLCPTGNDINELFCTKDVAVTQKSDLYFCTEDEWERQKRTRQYCHVCENYQPQCEDYYTYNDFLFFLRQE